MVWGCMTAKGVGGFCRIEGNLDAALYCEILEGELKDTIVSHGFRIDEIVFQQDNDPKHRSAKAQKCLDDLGINQLDWPAQSPDLNPIEHLWSYVKRKLGSYDVPAGGVIELWERFQHEWEAIPLQYVVTLIESMPRRIAAVLKAKGGHTKY